MSESVFFNPVQCDAQGFGMKGFTGARIFYMPPLFASCSCTLFNAELRTMGPPFRDMLPKLGYFWASVGGEERAMPGGFELRLLMGQKL